MKQSMVSPLTGQLPNKPFTLGGFASENKVCCLQNHHFLGWKTKKYGDLFCVWWLVIPMSSVVEIWWQKWPSRQKERITLKNVPPPKKRKNAHMFLFMSASTRCHHESTNQDLTVRAAFSGRAQNQVSYGGLGDISQPYQGDRSNKLGQFLPQKWLQWLSPKKQGLFHGDSLIFIVAIRSPKIRQCSKKWKKNLTFNELEPISFMVPDCKKLLFPKCVPWILCWKKRATGTPKKSWPCFVGPDHMSWWYQRVPQASISTVDCLPVFGGIVPPNDRYVSWLITHPTIYRHIHPPNFLKPTWPWAVFKARSVIPWNTRW